MYVKMFWMKTVALMKNDVTAFPDAVAAENKNQKIRNLFWKYFRAGLNNMQQNSNRNRKGLLSKAFLMSFFSKISVFNILWIVFQQQQHQGMLLHYFSSVPQSSSKTFLHTFPRNHLKFLRFWGGGWFLGNVCKNVLDEDCGTDEEWCNSIPWCCCCWKIIQKIRNILI